jgi:hypothetical protein
MIHSYRTSFSFYIKDTIKQFVRSVTPVFTGQSRLVVHSRDSNIIVYFVEVLFVLPVWILVTASVNICWRWTRFPPFRSIFWFMFKEHRKSSQPNNTYTWIHQVSIHTMDQHHHIFWELIIINVITVLWDLQEILLKHDFVIHGNLYSQRWVKTSHLLDPGLPINVTNA